MWKDEALAMCSSPSAGGPNGLHLKAHQELKTATFHFWDKLSSPSTRLNNTRFLFYEVSKTSERCCINSFLPIKLETDVIRHEGEGKEGLAFS